MEFSIKAGSSENTQTGCIVVGVFEPRKLSDAAAALDRATKGFLTRILKRGDMEGKPGTTLLLHDVPNVKAERVLLVGLGPLAEFRDSRYAGAITAAIRTLNATGATDALIQLPEGGTPRRDVGWRVAQATIAARAAAYRFEQMKSKPAKAQPGLRRLTFGIDDKNAQRLAATGLEQGLAIAHGVGLARDLGNLPGNVCTPTYLAGAARDLAKHYRMKLTVLERAQMEKLGMGEIGRAHV